jgi:hypothetical protein
MESDTLAPHAARGARPRPVALVRLLAVLGTVLVGLPLAAPFGAALVMAVSSGRFLLDYLMPGELFFAVIVGGIALVAAALLGRRLRVVSGIALGATVLLFLLVAVAADWTGLASGETAATGWPLALVAGAYGLYVLSVVGLLVAGVALCRIAFMSDRVRTGGHAA